ncbi:hypothetical protein BBFL7_02576 [Flavobacteria bacterium BBFL7]|nr:hypothetical protein BBFL7_02576 [Flavobacteria bacterium BBFL7]
MYQFFLNLPFGETMAEQTSISYYQTEFKFNGKELDSETGMYYYGARYYDPSLSIWMSVDPLAEQFPNFSPYNYTMNNPINMVDPDGRASESVQAPIYNREGEFLGTDDEGLKGKAIVMDEENFTQGMSHEEALKENVGEEGLCGDAAKTKLLDHKAKLKDRPDWDGYITLDEANKWFREGNGEPLFTSLEKINMAGLISYGENYVGEVKVFNLLINSLNANDGAVYGSITLKRYPNHTVRAFADTYNFELHDPSNPLYVPRNLETAAGHIYAGEGQSYQINLYGSKRITPLFPWLD